MEALVDEQAACPDRTHRTPNDQPETIATTCGNGGMRQCFDRVVRQPLAKQLM